MEFDSGTRAVTFFLILAFGGDMCFVITAGPQELDNSISKAKSQL